MPETAHASPYEGRTKHQLPSAQHTATVPDDEMPHALEIMHHKTSARRSFTASSSVYDLTDNIAVHDLPSSQLSGAVPLTVMHAQGAGGTHPVAALDT